VVWVFIYIFNMRLDETRRGTPTLHCDFSVCKGTTKKWRKQKKS